MSLLHTIITMLVSAVVAVCQLLAVFVIAVGVTKALVIYLRDSLFGARAEQAIRESRLELGHSFSLGLGFLIGGSIASTTIAPGWNEIGQLAAIIGLRTLLNMFLMHDISRDMNVTEPPQRGRWTSRIFGSVRPPQTVQPEKQAEPSGAGE